MKWTEDKCLSAIREFESFCHENNLFPSRDRYVAWQKMQKEIQGRTDLPSIGPIEERGPWNEMRRRASDDLSQLSLWCHRYRWSAEKCVAALRAFEKECVAEGLEPTQRRYVARRQEQPDTWPDLRVFKHYFVTWNKARLAAAEDPDQVRLRRPGGQRKA